MIDSSLLSFLVSLVEIFRLPPSPSFSTYVFTRSQKTAQFILLLNPSFRPYARQEKDIMYPRQKTIYNPISQNDEYQEPSPKGHPFDRKRLRYLILGLIVVLVVAATAIAALSNRTFRPAWKSCGNDPATAKSRGCSFDLISFAWQTPECYDASLVAEFAQWDTWAFYTEARGNMTVEQEVVLMGEQSLWVTWHYHLVHCTFMWRQMHRAYERGWIDAHLHAYNHTLHCQMVLLRTGVGHDEVFTKGNVIYPVCEQVGRSGGTSLWNSIYSL